MKNKLKSIGAAILAFAIMLSLSACTSPAEEAQKAVGGMLQAVKNADLNKVKNYTAGSDDEIDIGNVDKTGAAFKKISETLSWKIVSAEEKDNATVVVNTKISSPDLSGVLQEFMTKALQYAFSIATETPELSEEETQQKMDDLLNETILNTNTQPMESEVEITVTKDGNGKWRVNVDKTLANAIMGGFLEAAENMANTIED